MPIFYRPDASVAADFIPFYWQGKYHLFYLRDWRDPARCGEGTPWWHLVTDDFVHFEDWGEALPRGPVGSQDLWVFTGSVIEHAGTFHIFYTGHNHHLKEAGKPIQAVLHATSRDLRTWQKDTGFLFLAPDGLGYEPDDWRDPFVYWDERRQAFGMLLAARRKTGPSSLSDLDRRESGHAYSDRLLQQNRGFQGLLFRNSINSNAVLPEESVVHAEDVQERCKVRQTPGRNRGCVALATSPDLQRWTVQEPFWAPDEYFTHECPDLFRSGDWWYLVYSTFSERCVTHYRMSRSLAGPWLAPANDTFDGRAYYAAKTAGDGRRRFVFGWLPTRDQDKDDGGWQWGGELVVHEIVQRSGGTLTVRPPDSVLAEFAGPVALSPAPVLGAWQVNGDAISADAVGRVSMFDLGALPDECLLETTVTVAAGTVACGLLLRASTGFDAYYQLRLEPGNGRMVMDRWPRPGDQPFMLERSLALPAGQPVRLRVLLSGTNLVGYAADAVALSCRMYDLRAGHLGLFVAEGSAIFADTTVKTRC